MSGKLRALASDALIYGLATVVGRFLTFLLTPLYTNYLPTREEFGAVAYLYSILGFINILYSFGADSAFLRFYDPNDERRSGMSFSLSFWIIVVAGSIGSACCFIWAAPISEALFARRDYANLTRVAALMPFLDALVIVPYAYLRMKRRSRRFALLKLAAIIVNVAANWLLLVTFRKGIWGVVIAGAASSAIAVIMAAPELIRNLKFSFDKKLFNEMLRFALPTIPSSFSSMMLQVADRPIMMMLAGSAAVGTYQANYRLGIPMMLAVLVFEYAWKPFYLSHRDDPEIGSLLSRALVYFTAICGAIFLAGALFIEYVVQLPFTGGKFINPAYWSGLGIVPIVLAAYYFNGVFVNLSAAFHITKRTGYLPMATAAAAAANVVLNFVFIPLMGIAGGAWATFGAYLISAILAKYYAAKIYPVRYDWRKVGSIAAISAALYAIGALLPNSFLIRLLIFISYPAALFAAGIIPLHTFFAAAEKYTRRVRDYLLDARRRNL